MHILQNIYNIQEKINNLNKINTPQHSVKLTIPEKYLKENNNDQKIKFRIYKTNEFLPNEYGNNLPSFGYEFAFIGETSNGIDKNLMCKTAKIPSKNPNYVRIMSYNIHNFHKICGNTDD